MALLSAAQLKQRESPEFLVTLPGDGGQILARRPDLQTLIFEGFIPSPLINEVVRLVSDWAGKDDLAELTEEMVKKSIQMREFMNRWVCASMVSPKCALTEDGRDEQTVVITDLTLQTRMEVFNATFAYDAKERAAEVTAATAFPEVGSGERSGPNSEALRPETVSIGGDS